MALTVVCITGPGSTGKSSIIRQFTARHLKYEKAKGDVLGIFPMPHLGYAVGVSGSGDHLDFIIKGQKFLTRYDDLRVMIVASRSAGSTLQKVETFAKKAKATLHLVATNKLVGAGEKDAAIRANVSKIKRLMPRR